MLEYSKYSRDLKKKNDNTVIFEFSRGKEHGGYKGAFAHIPKTILKKAAIMYVNVSWEESLRKNRKRFNPDRPDSILEHGLSDDKLRALYFECDFQEINPDPIGFINIGNLKLPFINFENNDDVTTFQNKGLSKRLSEKLSALWNLKTFR